MHLFNIGTYPILLEQESLIEYEVDTVQEKRKISELQQTLLTVGKRNLKTQISITKKIEKITWLVKEKVPYWEPILAVDVFLSSLMISFRF